MIQKSCLLKVGLLALASMAGLGAQVVDPFRGMVEGTIQGMRLRNEMEEARAREELMRSQSEAIRARTELMRANNAALNQQTALSRQVANEFPAVVARLQKRFPDFDRYTPQSAALVREFNAPLDGSVSLDRYLEGLYVIAKYASFSPIAAPAPPPQSESPAAKLANDPDFHALPMPLKIKLLRDVDAAGMAPFKDEDVEMILLGMAEKMKGAGK